MRFPFASRANSPAAVTLYGCEKLFGIVLRRSLLPYSLRTVTLVWPAASAAPRLVKICTTPLAASEPYSELAAAPLMTSMRSMSSELMSASERREIVPSTMMSGSWLPVSDVGPRRRMRGAEPGSPFTAVTLAPATRPLRAPSGDEAGASLICALSTAATANVVFFCDVASDTPVVTTASRFSTSFSSSKFCSLRPAERVIERRIGRYPMLRASRLTGLEARAGSMLNE